MIIAARACGPFPRFMDFTRPTLSFVLTVLLGALALCVQPSVATAQSEPEKTSPEKPDQSKPEQALPDQTKPDEAKPPDTKPTEAKPAEPAAQSATQTDAGSSGAAAATGPTLATPAPSPAPRKCRKSRSGACKKRAASDSGPSKRVVRNGSTSEPTVKLAPTVPTNVASQQTQVTEQLLAAAENNLKEAVLRQLNADQTAVVDQVRNYIQQARAATKAGDIQRGHNLAVKARLLSDDLIAQ